MPSANWPEEGRQGELIIIAEKSGQMHVPEFSTPATAVPIVERNILLQNAITHLAVATIKNNFIRRDDYDIATHQRHAPPGVRIGAERARAKAQQDARQDFIRATGNEALLAAGLITQRQFDRLNRHMFSGFLVKYYGNHYAEGQEYRRRLANHVRVLQTPKEPVEEVEVRANDEPEDLPDLDTPARLQAIFEDPRAGFLPQTNREKNQVLAYLDYQDNPSQYPFGVNNQFLEVFTHAQKVRRNNQTVDSQRGPVSIVYEIGDYLANATRQIAALQSLGRQLHELPDKRRSLAEESDWVDLKHAGFAALIQYRDLHRLMAEGDVPGVKSPLLTRENRWTAEGAGQHKIVEDRYTTPNISKAFAAYIKRQTEALKVGEARALLAAALINQSKRQAYMRSRLEEVATPPYEMQGAARDVLRQASDAAMRILDEFHDA